LTNSKSSKRTGEGRNAFPLLIPVGETMDNFIFYMHEDFYSNSIKIFIGQESKGRRYAGQITFTEVTPGEICEETICLPLKSDFPEQMKQALKAMGRLQFADEATIKAKDYHLEDMRKLVFKNKAGSP
jgi:hypothetical protein